MNLAAMQYGIGSNAVSALAPSAATVADPFDKSPLNPVNMSRTADKPATETAPSGKLLERVRVAAADLAELACVQAGWRFVSEKNNTTVYEMNGAVLPPSVSVASTFGGAGGNASDYYLVKAVTTVSVDVDSVLSLLDTRTTEQYALRMNQVFGKHYQNAVVIDHMSCTDPPAQFLSEDGALKSFTGDDAYAVNWLSLKSAGAVDGSIDFTLASYQDAFQRSKDGGLLRLGRLAARDPPRRGDGADRLLGVHALTSFNFKDIPELPKWKNSTRIHLRNTGFVVEETADRGVFRLTFFLALTPTATTLKHAKRFEKWLQTMANCVANLALQAKPEPVASKKPVWSKSNHCMLCLKGFHAFRRCHHCRFCGDAVCNKCSGFVDVSKFDQVQTLHGKIRPAAMPALSDQYSETRGCTRCIQSLMDDVNNQQAKPSTSASSSSVEDQPPQPPPPPRRLSSASGSQSGGSSGRNSKLSSSFLSNPPLLSQEEDVLLLDGSSDRASSNNHNNSFLASQHQPSQHGVPVLGTRSVASNSNTSSSALAIDDLDEYDPAPKGLTMSMLAKPPVDAKSSLSMSTASTSFSYEEQSASMRVSGASHDSSYNGHGMPTRYAPSAAMLSATMPPYQRATTTHGHMVHDYMRESDVLALSGLAIHNVGPHQQLYDEQVDTDGPPHPLARSTVTIRSTNAMMMNARPPRPTMGSHSGSVHKYAMATSHSIHSEPEAEPIAEPYPGGFYGKPSEFARGNRATGNYKLFSISSGPRLNNQPPRAPVYQYQQPQQLPPVYQQSRPSSSSSSISSLQSSDLNSDMIALPLGNGAAGTSGGQSDMILLAPPPAAAPEPVPEAPLSPQFVVFSSSRRESIIVRPDNGSDMIPLKL